MLGVAEVMATGVHHMPRSRLGTAVVSEVQTMREWMRRPNEKKGMDKPSATMSVTALTD